MEKCIDTFARMELKYQMDETQFEGLMDEIRNKLIPDMYPRSVVNSIYFDTPDHELILKSLEKPVYKEKLRLRTYGGTVSDNCPAFAEIKKKYNGRVYKRRVDGTYQELLNWLSGVSEIPGDTQIHREISYFLTVHGDLSPAMQIAYNRLAFVAVDDPSVRITFDRDIIWRDKKLYTDGNAYGTRLLDESRILMEIKVQNKAIPIWLVSAVENHGISRSSISKYGTAFLRANDPAVLITPIQRKEVVYK